MSAEITFTDGNGEKHRVRDMEPTTAERFRDLRHYINERNDREVTNDEVLDLLVDVWWHHDRQGADS